MRRPIILANKLYVPASLVDRDDLRRWSYEWEETVYEEKEDEFGELIFKPNGEPEVEPVTYLRHLKTYSKVYTGKGNYYAFPRGNMQKLTPFMKSPRFIDIRSAPAIPARIALNKETRRDDRWANQYKCILNWMHNGGTGLIKGTTGSGKTVIGVGITAKLGLRTLILSTLTDAFRQWSTEYYLHTNLKDCEDDYGSPLLGKYNSNSKKPKIYPITIATVQSFKNTRLGHRRLRDLQDQFGLVILDEAHELCTEEYHVPVELLNPLCLLSLTATPDRTDRRELLLFDMAGPIVAVNETEQMPPQVTFVKTGESAPGWLSSKPYRREYKWTMTLSHLAKAKARNEIILRWMMEDLKANKRVAAYSERREIISYLRDRLVGEGFRVGYVDGTVTKNRQKIYKDFREGKIDVLCAGRVLRALVNLPELNCLHVCTPVNKESAILQIYGRTRRIKKGKKISEVRYYVDDGGQLTGAYKNNLKVCRANNWVVKDEDTLKTAGMTRWINRKKKK